MNVLKYLKTIGILNAVGEGRGYGCPVDSVVDGNGRIFTVSRKAPESGIPQCRVGVATLHDDWLGQFGELGDGPGQFRLPTALAVGGRGQIYLADEHNHRINIWEFDTEGRFVDWWGVPGSGGGELSGPSGIAVDADDNMYVVDHKNNRVQKFTAEGRFLTKWGEPGTGPGQFDLPWGMTLDSHGYVWVADWRNDRVQKFTPDGEFVAAYGSPGDGDGQFHRPSSVAVADDGMIFVADWGNERVVALDPDGRFIQKLRGEATVSQWGQEFLEVNPDEAIPRAESNLVPNLPSHFTNPDWISAVSEPLFAGPVSVKLDGDGRLYVTEAQRHRIQIYERV